MADGSDHLLNCPNCGAELPRAFRHARLATCAYCDSTVLLDDAGLRLAGSAGVMAEAPSLLALGVPFTHRDLKLLPVGHARFSYEHGSWDEWWVLDTERGRGVWVSVDEGDIAIEEPLAVTHGIPAFAELLPGAAVELAGGERLVVTERGSATCEAVRGELPEALRPGDTLRYAHLSGPRGRLVTVEVGRDDAVRCTAGRWLDPFEIRPA